MNLFLVEDEHWALAELVELFKKYEPDHKVYSFANGEDALAAARKIKPQLVLTDINMPGMDGLELFTALRLLDSGVKCIILSVHDQFEYVQKGVKIGVLDYLLKPVNKDALYKTTDKAIRSIEVDTQQKGAMINWSITQMLLASGNQEDEISDSIFNQKYCIALLLLENWASAKSWKETGVTNHTIRKHFTYDSIREEDIHTVDIDSQRKVILIPALHDASYSGIQSHLASFYQQLHQDRLCVQLSYVFKKEKENVSKYFAFLNQQIVDHMRLGASTFISPNLKTEDVDISELWDMVRALEPVYKKGEIRKGRETIQKIVEGLRRKKITMRQLQLFLNDMFYSLKYKLYTSAKMDLSFNKQQEDIKIPGEFTTYDELLDWLCNKILGLFSEQEPELLKPKDLIPKLIQWVHDNYQHDISLQQFAAHNHVSLGYLSRLFKLQMGETFSNYIIRYRVEKAKKLLAAGIEQLSDVSSLVGYEDPKHFRYVFKKIVGEPPNAYLKRKK